MPAWSAEGLALACLIAVLAFAVIRPRGLPEGVAAVPAAVLVIVVGALPLATAWQEVQGLGATVAFLAAILMLAHLCREEGMFDAAGELMARRSAGRPTRLLGLVFVVASLTTAVLSLDATVVLLTPVVFATASRLGVRPKPHVYATSHLANSASLLLPVSNLTNLLAMGAAGLSFAKFGSLMALPWLAAIGIEYAVHRRWFASDLSVAATPRGSGKPTPVPVFAMVVVALTLAGFVVSSPLHIEPFWAALAGVVVLVTKRLLMDPPGAHRAEVRDLLGAANAWFLLFVLGLGVIVRAVVDNGLAAALGHLVPTGSDLVSLLLLAGLAALLANLVNNLPAVLVLLPLVAPGGAAAVLAVLIGVNIGPNLTYVGSLATLLWRRILADHDHDAEIGEFTRLGLLTVPVSLIACTAALWVSVQLMGV
jgi:arsenical pump membrane protein